jgi:hypothetical protein
VTDTVWLFYYIRSMIMTIIIINTLHLAGHDNTRV